MFPLFFLKDPNHFFLKFFLEIFRDYIHIEITEKWMYCSVLNIS